MDFGTKMKEMRILLGLTQEELANRCELTKSYISQLENGKTSPSLETLEIIVEVLGTNISDFFNDLKKPKLVFNEEEQYEKDFDGYKQTWLMPTSQILKMESMIVEIEPHKEIIHDNPHVGEEFGYVLEGTVTVVYGNQKEKCHKGESFYYVSDKVHYLINEGNKTAKVIWVSCPPNF